MTPNQMIHDLLIKCRVNPGFTYTDEKVLWDLVNLRENVENKEAAAHIEAAIQLLKSDLDIQD